MENDDKNILILEFEQARWILENVYPQNREEWTKYVEEGLKLIKKKNWSHDDVEKMEKIINELNYLNFKYD
jgi:ssDNA-specific exonuclease RecJ